MSGSMGRAEKTAQHNKTAVYACSLALMMGVFADGLCAAKDKKPREVTVPVLQLEAGRKLVFERAFSSERDVETKRGFWKKVVDVVAGAPEFKSLRRPYSVVADSKGRIIVTDPDAGGVHIFDFKQGDLNSSPGGRRARKR